MRLIEGKSYASFVWHWIRILFGKKGGANVLYGSQQQICRPNYKHAWATNP